MLGGPAVAAFADFLAAPLGKANRSTCNYNRPVNPSLTTAPTARRK